MPSEHEKEALHYDAKIGQTDPSLRKELGVWYTPLPIVRFIVRGVDELLRTAFGIPDGITAAHHPIRILDPATGTGQFLASVISHIRASWPDKSTWATYASNTLIPRLFGVDLMEDALAIAHCFLAQEMGCECETSLHLTQANSLAGDELLPPNDTPNSPLVLLGNPPYNNEKTPTNTKPWILELLAPYKMEPGGQERLRERKLNLNDDYVKFIRLAEHYIERNGVGFVAFITAHGFLSNPTFRGMRWHLLRTFDRIYSIDLHGNTRKGETADGADQNVFEIQQGVAITLFVRTTTNKEKPLGEVLHYSLKGRRKDKFQWLDNGSVAGIPWQSITPEAPYYLFVPRDTNFAQEYEKGFAIDKLMPLHSIGICSAQNNVLIHKQVESLRATIQDIIDLPDAEFIAKYKIRESPNWEPRLARADIGATFNPQRVQPYAFQPFDTRLIYYGSRSKGILGRPRHEVSQHLLEGNNIAFILENQCYGTYSHCFCTRNIVDLHAVGANSYAFPLYTLHNGITAGKKPTLAPNLNRAIYQEICNILGEEAEPQALFDYIYATLHCPTYRTRFAEQLRIGFPRIPYPTNPETFHRLAELGAKLRTLHLMDGADSWQTGVRFEGQGDSLIEEPKWVDANGTGRLYINPSQFFTPLPKEVWEFRIGSYQPMLKWLRERKGEPIDANHYRRMAHAIRETLTLMAEIDTVWAPPV